MEELDKSASIIFAPEPEKPPPKRKPRRIIIPRRAPSIIKPLKQIVYISADKTTCAACTCFPYEEPYISSDKKKRTRCQKTPLTLYELAALAVNGLPFPAAFGWSEEQVADWMENDLGMPQYRECILVNHMNGLRLLFFEDPSRSVDTNIRYFKDLKIISANIRELFSMDFIRFARSIGLPPRKPLTHCTWFKSRTGPSWGIRQNWERDDILRWMKILMPSPLHLDHWDLVWYLKPDFDKVLFARVGLKPDPSPCMFKYPEHEPCREYLAQRKFIITKDIPQEQQLIWMESQIHDLLFQKPWKFGKSEESIRTPVMNSRLIREPVVLEGKAGRELLLAKRLAPKQKFFPVLKPREKKPKKYKTKENGCRCNYTPRD